MAAVRLPGPLRRKQLGGGPGPGARRRREGKDPDHHRRTNSGARAREGPASELSRPAHPRSADPSHHDPIRRQEPKLTTGFDHLPPALMHQPMVVMTEQHKVGQIARSTSSPMNDVVRTRPVDLAVATREPAALVANP